MDLKREQTMGLLRSRKSRALCSLLTAIALVGCTTNITPPSGPVDTEVCFDPAPITGTQDNPVGEPLPCGWWVYFHSGDTVVADYTFETCVDIPPEFSPGDEIFIRINGDWGGIKCAYDWFASVPWVPGFTLFGDFVVTD